MTTYDMLKQSDSGKQLDVITLDFSKAFDTVTVAESWANSITMAQGKSRWSEEFC